METNELRSAQFKALVQALLFIFCARTMGMFEEWLHVKLLIIVSNLDNLLENLEML